MTFDQVLQLFATLLAALPAIYAAMKGVQNAAKLDRVHQAVLTTKIPDPAPPGVTPPASSSPAGGGAAPPPSPPVAPAA